MVQHLQKRDLIYILFILSILIFLFNYAWIINNTFIPIINGEIKGDYTHYYNAFNVLISDASSLYLSKYEKLSPTFIYPPPSIVLLSPIFIFGYVPGFFLISILSFLAYIFSIYLFFQLFQDKFTFKSLDWKFHIFIILISLAPLVQNIKSGQINSFILLISALSLFYHKKNNTKLSAFFLILGFWFKIYPIILLPFLLNKDNYKEYIIYSIIYIFSIPILLMYIIPINLYSEYFFTLVPRISEVLIIGSFNQSLSAFLMRLNLPTTSIYNWEYLIIPSSIRIFNLFLMIVSYCLLYYIYLKKLLKKEIIWGFLLTFSCIFTPIGWEYTYVLATLLLFCVLYDFQSYSKLGKIFSIVLIVSLLIPKLPDEMIIYTVNTFPNFLNVIFYNRFILSFFLFLLYEIIKSMKKKV